MEADGLQGWSKLDKVMQKWFEREGKITRRSIVGAFQKQEHSLSPRRMRDL